jgi:ABC-type multidrug transport system ATPase subunit
VQTPHTTFRLDAQGLSKSINGRKILSNISLSIHPGEFVGLLGPSGAGKSTLLTALNGFRPAEQGRVLLNGNNLYEGFDRFRTLLGYVPQDDIVHTSLSVYKALHYAAQLRLPDFTREAIKERVVRIVRTLGLEAQLKTKIKKLSGGQRKRVSLGIELLTSPPLLFLDEPTSGLDPGLEERMMQLFHKLSSDGRTVILTTHIMESLHLLHLVAILYQGWLAFYGPPQLALQAFQVKEFADIYAKLDRFQPAALAGQFRNSPIYKKYITHRLSKRYKTEQIAGPQPEPERQPPAAQPQSQAQQPSSPPPAQAATSESAAVQSLEDELEQLKRKMETDG